MLTFFCTDHCTLFLSKSFRDTLYFPPIPSIRNTLSLPRTQFARCLYTGANISPIAQYSHLLTLTSSVPTPSQWPWFRQQHVRCDLRVLLDVLCDIIYNCDSRGHMRTCDKRKVRETFWPKLTNYKTSLIETYSILSQRISLLTWVVSVKKIPILVLHVHHPDICPSAIITITSPSLYTVIKTKRIEIDRLKWQDLSWSWSKSTIWWVRTLCVQWNWYGDSYNRCPIIFGWQ